MQFPPVVSGIARSLKGARGAFVALAVLHAAWLTTHLGGDRWRVLIGDAFFVPTFVAIGLFAWRAAGAYRRAEGRTGSPEARQLAHAWTQLAVAYGILWVSNLSWFWSDLTGTVSVEPFYSRLLDLAAYSLLVIGLLRFPAIQRDRGMRRRISLDLLTIGVGATLVTWHLLIRPLAARAPGAGIGDLGAFITPLGDVAVVVAVSAVMFRHGTARDRRWLRWLVAGHLASCIASLVAGVLQLKGAYRPGAPIDALWMFSDLLIFLAADDAARQADVMVPSTVPARSDRRRLWDLDDGALATPVSGVQLWLPYVFAALAFGVLVAETSSHWRGTLGIVVAANALVLLLVALRQQLAYRDNMALARAHLAQERRFRSLVQFSSDLITVVDRAGTIVYQSPAVERVLGYAAQATIGTPVLLILHPDEHHRFARMVERGVQELGHGVDGRATDGRLGSGRPSLWRLRHNSGRYLWVESVATKLAGDDADGGLLVINTRDVTERVLLEEELRSAQKMEAVGRLAGGIAHDFNNLLTAVRVNVALIRPTPDGTRTDELDEIEAAVDRAALLTRQLLTFSQRQVIQAQRLELGTVVRGLEPLVRRLIGPFVELRVDTETGCWLEADPGQLEQIVMNLAVNSRDAMPQGGVLRIGVGSSIVSIAQARQEPGLLPGPYVDLVVDDTGEGMSTETLGHVFEPFFTTKPDGSGLGLSTVFGIATQLGGHVAVQSVPGRGTRFDVRLPRAEEGVHLEASSAQSSGGEGAASVRPQRSVPKGHGECVLVVDDEDTVRRALQRILARHGYDVLTAADGVEALEVEARTDGPIHVLLTDVMMPRMDGRELMLRFLERRPDAAIVCMSGYVDDALRESLPLGDCSFLAKPFSVETVVSTVQRELEARARI